MTSTVTPRPPEPTRPRRRGTLALAIGVPVLVVVVLAVTVAAVLLPAVLRAGIDQRTVAAGRPAVTVSAEHAAFDLAPSTDGRVHVAVTGWAIGTPATTVTTTGGRTAVRVTCGVWPWLPACSLRIAVTLPSTAALTVTGTNGEIRVRDLSGALAATTTNGAIDAAGPRGDLRLQSVNGRIAVTGAASARLTARTVNGSIDLASVTAPDDLVAQTVNGSATVRLPGAATYAVTARTTNGRVDTSRMRTDPASGHRVEVTTVNGSVTVLPAG